MASLASNDSDLQGENLLLDSTPHDEEVAEAEKGIVGLAITTVRAPQDEDGIRVKAFGSGSLSNRLVIALYYGTTSTGMYTVECKIIELTPFARIRVCLCRFHGRGSR